MSFWDTDAMKVAAVATEQHLGPMGRYINEITDPKFLDVRLYTHTAGIFWYGDISWLSEKSKLEAVAKELKEVVYIVPILDGANETPIYKQAIAQVTP